jgi:hypothetical protein
MPAKQEFVKMLKPSDLKAGDKVSAGFEHDTTQLRADVLHQVKCFIDRQSDAYIKDIFMKYKQEITFKVGDSVEGLYKNGKWYPATIAAKGENGNFTLNWSDGDTADRTKSSKELRFKNPQAAAAIEREVMPKENLKLALEDIGFKVQAEDVEAIFESMDSDGDAVLDLTEFKLAVTRPSKALKEIERWTTSMPFQQLIASGFVLLAEHDKAPLIRKKDKGGEEDPTKKDPLRSVSKCSEEDFTAVCDCVLEGCRKLLVKHHAELRTAYEALDKQKFGKGSDDDQSKFSLNTMSCGGVPDFYEGLGGRVGKSALHTFYPAQAYPAA